MVERKLDRGSEEWQFFTDFWQFRQKYYEIENDDEFTVLMEAGEALIEKYACTDFAKFARQLIFSHFEFVEDKWKGKRS